MSGMWCIDEQSGGKPPHFKGVLHVQEGLVEVGDDVFGVFDADREAGQAIGDADALANFHWHGRVRHLRGKRYEGFDTAETLR